MTGHEIKFDGALTRNVLENIICKAHALRGLDPENRSLLWGDLPFIASMIGVSPQCIDYWFKRCDTKPVHAGNSIRKVCHFLDTPLTELGTHKVGCMTAAARVPQPAPKVEPLRNHGGRKPMTADQRAYSETSRCIKTLSGCEKLNEPHMWRNVNPKVLAQILAGINGIRPMIEKDLAAAKAAVETLQRKIAALS